MISGYESVVAAIDFGAASHRVLEHAMRVVGPSGTLHLLHVVEWVPTVMEGMLSGYASPRDMRALHDAAVAKLADYVRLCGTIRTTSEVVEGGAALSVLEAAERRHADLLVIGTQGRSRASRLLLGHVMERVLRQASCPVLVVR